MSSEQDLLRDWGNWHNYGRNDGDNRPEFETPESFNIQVLNDHGRIERAVWSRDLIYMTCLVCGRPLGSVAVRDDDADLAIGSAKRGLRKHLRKEHGIPDPYADLPA